VEMLKLEEAMIEDYTPKQKSRIWEGGSYTRGTNQITVDAPSLECQTWYELLLQQKKRPSWICNKRRKIYEFAYVIYSFSKSNNKKGNQYYSCTCMYLCCKLIHPNPVDSPRQKIVGLITTVVLSRELNTVEKAEWSQKNKPMR
jgi:hypothetical protein